LRGVPTLQPLQRFVWAGLSAGWDDAINEL
jgi:hypothetical protein